MDVPWEEYRGLFKKAYFGDHEGAIAPREHDLAKDFWKFHKRYVEVAVKKGQRCADEPSSSSDPRVYCKHDRVNVKVELDNTSKYVLREVPEHIRREFSYIVSAYLQFLQRQRFAKLKQLRECQRKLPIAERRQDILDALQQNNIVIIAGDTGCGKSTQVPQYLLASGYSHIACTQPRRIACISLSKRVAFETLNEYGTRVAYAIRFEKTRTMATRLLFLTEGLLLRQMAQDPRLDQYQVIMLDEVHERHLHGDLLIGLLRMLGVQRTNLKLILMSATINLKLFQEYFPDAPVIQVPGRLYAIELHYLPIKTVAEKYYSRDSTLTPRQQWKEEKKAEKIDPAPYQRVLQMIDGKYPSSERGDVLIFLSGINEIQSVGEVLKLYAEQTKRWIILFLHSTLSLEEQDRVFDVAPEGIRKCVLSTNIGETSVTIDGIRFVVDSGKVKQMTYDTESRTHLLKETWVSKASAEQRKGRAGRTGPGVCYRLYAASDYEKFEDYDRSEIHRVALDSVVMQIYNLDLGVDPRSFPFIEPPDTDRIIEAIESLRDQRAVEVLTEVVEQQEADEAGPPITKHIERLTQMGKVLVNIPVDVPIGKMLITASLFGQVETMLTIAAGLSVQSIFTQRSYRDAECQAARAQLLCDHGDAFTLVNVYREWIRVRVEGADYTRRWCRQRGIEEQRLYDIAKLRQQFADLLVDADLTSINELAQRPEAQGSHERRIRAGEMQRLRTLKRQARQDQRKRKMLKPNEHYDTIGSEKSDAFSNLDDSISTALKEERRKDVHSLEFDMRHADEELIMQKEAHRLTHSKVTMLKFLLCSGLYPQYGVLDHCNQYKVGADLMVHTLPKAYCVIHPNGGLAYEPECLQGTRDKHDRASYHQLIFYSMLLETTKPYLVNCIRVPALHTLLLLARKVEVTVDYSRVVCDDFVEFTMHEETAMDECNRLCSMATKIRYTLRSTMDSALCGERSTAAAKELSELLQRFFQIELVYAMKRQLHSEAERRRLMFERQQMDDAQRDAFITINSAVSEPSYAQYIARPWQCPMCKEEFVSTAEEKQKHLIACNIPAEEMNNTGVEQKTAPVEPVDPSLKAFNCDKCKQTLWLKPIEILKHKRSCQ